MATLLPTLPGKFLWSGCVACRPGILSNAGGRIHEGHFSVGLGDARMNVTIDGVEFIGIREVIIDRETLLAQVWVYPEPRAVCGCGANEALIEVWYDVPGVVVSGQRRR